MDRRQMKQLGILALSLGTLLLSGCMGCDAERRAEAQSLDAGFPSPPDPMGPADCYVTAQRRTRLLDDQQFFLCQGAPSAGPVACYEAARRRTGFNDSQRIALCRCARGMQPVACVEFLRREARLTDAQMLELCSPTVSGVLLPNCRPAGGWY